MSHLNESRSIIAKPNAFLYLRLGDSIPRVGRVLPKIKRER